jgi:hypothetical protein
LHTSTAFVGGARRFCEFVAIRSSSACVQPDAWKEEDTMDTEAIALIVDEPIAGHFYWVLQKQDGSDCRPIDAAEGPMPTYGAAMMAGIAALQRRNDARTNPGAQTLH